MTDKATPEEVEELKSQTRDSCALGTLDTDGPDAGD